MRYFKLIDNETIIGAASSNNFMRYEPRTKCFLHTDENKGEYIAYKNKFYRSTWMVPTVLEVQHTVVNIVEIEEDEYNIINDAIEKDEGIVIPPKEEEEINWQDDSIAQYTLDFIRSSKLTELSRACRAAIESGIDLEFHGETHHFSLTTQDQLNLMSLSATAQTQDLIPYHADGELYTYYTAEEINSIIKAANDHKVYHTAYYNSLKAYVNALTTIEEIAAVTYGTEVPDEYKSDVLRVLE